MRRYFMIMSIVSVCSSMYAGNPGDYIEEPEATQLANPRAIYHDMWAKYIKIKTIKAAPIRPRAGEYGYLQSERTLLIRAQAAEILHLAALLSKNRRDNRDYRVTRREISELRALATPYRRNPHRYRRNPLHYRSGILAYDSEPEDDDKDEDGSLDAPL